MQEYALVFKIYAEKFNSKGSIVKALEKVPEEYGKDNVYVRTELIYRVISTFVSLVNTEKMMTDLCAKEVKKHPLWETFFNDVKRCGPLMAAICIAYLDPYKTRWPSSFWKYTGLDVVTDANDSHGRGRSDTVTVDYIYKNGERATRRGLSYNPFVKTKLVGVLGPSFLKAGKDTHYARKFNLVAQACYQKQIYSYNISVPVG